MSQSPLENLFTRCQNCGIQLPPTGVVCPRCGHERPFGRIRLKLRKFFGCGAIIVGVIWGVISAFRPSNPSTESHPAKPSSTVEVRRADPVSQPEQLQSVPSTPAAQPRPSRLYSISGIAINDTLNVRSGPGANYEVADKLAGTRKDIQIIGDSVMNGPTEWVHITYAGKSGWVSKQYLKAN